MPPRDDAQRDDPTSRPASDSACILWHPIDTQPPAELLKSLTKHGANVQPCSDAYTALALACRGGRRVPQTVSGPRLDSPAAPAPRAVLVLMVEPDALPAPGPALFVRAVRRYAPRSACWWYSTSFSPPFRAVTSQDMARWETRDAAKAEGLDDKLDGVPTIPLRPVPSPFAVAPPPLRLAREAAAPPQPVPAPSSPHIESKPGASRSAPVPTIVRPPDLTPTPAPASSSALTADELSMLLGNADPQPPPGRANPPAPPSHGTRNNP